MNHLTLSGRNDDPIGYRAVYVDSVQIGVVFRQYGQTWAAEDMQGRNHGSAYTTDWNAAKQLALAIGKSETEELGACYERNIARVIRGTE